MIVVFLVSEPDGSLSRQSAIDIARQGYIPPYPDATNANNPRHPYGSKGTGARVQCLAARTHIVRSDVKNHTPYIARLLYCLLSALCIARPFAGATQRPTLPAVHG